MAAQDSPFDPRPTPTPPQTGPLVWHHIEPEFFHVGPAAMMTAKTASWSTQPTATNARHLRALLVMSLQAATISAEPRPLGILRADNYADAEHNAAGAALARTINTLSPPGPAMLTTNLTTFGGSKSVPITDTDTGALPAVAIVLIVCAAAAAAAYIADRTAEVVDSTNFRNNRTQQLLTTQARTIEVISKHAEREKTAGRPLPFDDEERRVLGLLEDTQRQIATERRHPLPSPFDGAREFAGGLSNLASNTSSALGALLPIALIGGAFYLLSRTGDEIGPALRPAPKREVRSTPEIITLTPNKDGVYVHDQ